MKSQFGRFTVVCFLAFAALGCPKKKSEPQPPPQVIISISPLSATVIAGGSIQFSATVFGASDASVTWGATVGSVGAGGLYTAPATAGLATVTATSVADSSKSATAQITILPLPQTPPSGTLSGENCVVKRGETTCATAVNYSVANNGWNVYFWDSVSGKVVTVSGSGTRSVTVNADSPTYIRLFYFAEDNSSRGKTDIAALDLKAIVPPPVTISVSPTTLSISIGATQQFIPEVKSDPDMTVRWFVNGIPGGNETVGKITDGGLYTAPQVVPDPATVTVKAVPNTDPSKSATASVTIFSLTWTKFFANPVRETEAKTVIIDSAGRAIVSFQENIPGTSDTAAGIVVLDKAGNIVSTWTSAVPSEINGMAYVPEENVFWAAGTIGGDAAHPELRQAWLLKFRNSANPEVISDKRFQLGGKRTEVKTLQIANGKIWLGAETDDILYTVLNLRTNMRVVVLDLAANIETSFGVGYTGFPLVPEPFMRIFVAEDHIWQTNDGYFGNQLPSSYVVTEYSLDGRLVGSPSTLTNKFGVRSVEDNDGNLYVGGTHLGITSSAERLFNLDRLPTSLDKLLPGDPVWNGDNPGGVNIARDIFVNPAGGVVLVGSLSRIGISDTSLTDSGAAAWDIRDGRHVIIWKRRFNNVSGGSVFSWNSGAFASDGYLILVGAGTDGRSDCGRLECRTAAIMRIAR